MLQLREMDDRVPLADQLSEEVGPVILINTFRVAPEDAGAPLEAWAADAAYLKQQPGRFSRWSGGGWVKMSGRNYADYSDFFLLLVAVPAIAGEFSLTGWLLLRGGKEPGHRAQARQPLPD